MSKKFNIDNVNNKYVFRALYIGGLKFKRIYDSKEYKYYLLDNLNESQDFKIGTIYWIYIRYDENILTEINIFSNRLLILKEYFRCRNCFLNRILSNHMKPKKTRLYRKIIRNFIKSNKQKMYKYSIEPTIKTWDDLVAYAQEWYCSEENIIVKYPELKSLSTKIAKNTS